MRTRKVGRTCSAVPLEVDHGCLIATLGDVRVLVDTGAPVSFGGREVVIGGERHLLSFPVPALVDEIRALSGARFDAVLGTNVLVEYAFTLDTRRGEMRFGEMPEGRGERVELLIGAAPCTPVVVGGERVRCILDTGASIAFRQPGVHGSLPPVSRRSDFTIHTGRFETAVWRRRARVLGHDLELEFGEMPREVSQLFALTGAEGLMGMELLESGRLGFDLAARRVIFAPFEDAVAVPADATGLKR